MPSKHDSFSDFAEVEDSERLINDKAEELSVSDKFSTVSILLRYKKKEKDYRLC